MRSQSNAGTTSMAPPVTNMAANLECPFSYDDDDFFDFAFRKYNLLCSSVRERLAFMPPSKNCENPMELYSDTEFLIHYHFTKQTVYRLLELLTPKLHRKSWPPYIADAAPRNCTSVLWGCCFPTWDGRPCWSVSICSVPDSEWS